METITSILVSLVGLCILVIAFIALAIRSKGNQSITWSGLGVTFEIKPCLTCAGYKRRV